MKIDLKVVAEYCGTCGPGCAGCVLGVCWSMKRTRVCLTLRLRTGKWTKSSATTVKFRTPKRGLKRCANKFLERSSRPQ